MCTFFGKRVGEWGVEWVAVRAETWAEWSSTEFVPSRPAPELRGLGGTVAAGGAMKMNVQVWPGTAIACAPTQLFRSDSVK